MPSVGQHSEDVGDDEQQQERAGRLTSRENGSEDRHRDRRGAWDGRLAETDDHRRDREQDPRERPQVGEQAGFHHTPAPLTRRPITRRPITPRLPQTPAVARARSASAAAVSASVIHSGATTERMPEAATSAADARIHAAPLAIPCACRYSLQQSRRPARVPTVM